MNILKKWESQNIRALSEYRAFEIFTKRAKTKIILHSGTEKSQLIIPENIVIKTKNDFFDKSQNTPHVFPYVLFDSSLYLIGRGSGTSEKQYFFKISTNGSNFTIINNVIGSLTPVGFVNIYSQMKKNFISTLIVSNKERGGISLMTRLDTKSNIDKDKFNPYTKTYHNVEGLSGSLIEQSFSKCSFKNDNDLLFSSYILNHQKELLDNILKNTTDFNGLLDIEGNLVRLLDND